MIIPDWYNTRREFIETALKQYLEEYFTSEGLFLGHVDNEWLKEFRQACFYAVAWWKKLRAILALEFYLSLTKKSFEAIKFDDDIIKYCIAMELMHSFSLVHDDMPCMDNDTLRRGKETVWKKYGEYQWLLVWDFLNTLAFECISTMKHPVLSVKLSHLLSRSSGYHGMVWGQLDDMYYEKFPEKLAVWDLLKLHNRKTGALIRASVQWWILASWKIQHIHKLSAFGEKLGLAFQIKDDILDVEWSVEETGKSVGWEDKWFVHFMWIKKTKEYLDEVIGECFELTKTLGSEHISFLIHFVKQRSK